MARRGGFDRKFFESLGADVTDAAVKALEDGAKIVIEEAKGRVPVKSGALKESIHYTAQSKGRRIKIVADAKDNNGKQYGQYVEFDPRINHPFLYPAMDAKRAEIKQKIIEAIREACRENAIER